MNLRQGLSCLFLPAALMFGGVPNAAAQESHAAHGDAGTQAPPAAMKRMRWSDPAAWPAGKVPGAGDQVTIGRDMDVVLDADAPALRSLTIEGRLSFSDDRDIGLETEWIYLRGGELAIGSEASPYKHNATITLTNTIPGEDINTMGDRGIMLMGGTLNLHGDREHTWTKLAQTAERGSSSIEVLDA
ncbi:MAG TPA: G8 domain-containing protein, partial [Croceibacterium sp.]